VVPEERIHIVVVPPSGSAPTVLLQRFARAANLDFQALTPPDRELNTAVGRVEAELLRRLNMSLGRRLNERQYRHIINLLKPVLRSRGTGGSIQLPDTERSWVAEASCELVEFLEGSAYNVVGDIDELLSNVDTNLDGGPHGVTDEELADVAIAALTAIAEHHANYWWKVRRRKQTSEADASTRLTSAGRALAFTAKVRALEAADSNWFLARAARLYLRGRSGFGTGRR
jgi:hypothetical protein